MFPRWRRLGIRPQLTFIVILGAILSTVATLFIADNAIQNYVLDQARTQEQQNMNIMRLVLETQYGPNISIAHDNTMVVDQPSTSQGTFSCNPNAAPSTPCYGRYVLNNDTDLVDNVQNLIGGNVSIFQCANATGSTTGCLRIATTFGKGSSSAGTSTRATGQQLCQTVARNMNLDGTPRAWLGTDTCDGAAYFANYAPLFNPQGQFIGVLYVGVPLDVITTVVSRTTIELVVIGSIIMIAGIIFALFFANTIVGTLQRAARQISGASERMGGIAAQQSSGAAQQVWAINAINQALQNFSETAKDISHRTDQLALMGNQVLQRRAEISPAQIDSILAYITRSVRDISVASKQQSVQYERMTGAMQAVIEIAEQVAGNSQQASESSERLELVVRQMRQLVGVRLGARKTTEDAMAMELAAEIGARAGIGANSQNDMRDGKRARSPLRRNASGPATGGNGMGNPMGGPGQMMFPDASGVVNMGAMGNAGGMGNMGNMGMMPPMSGPMRDAGGQRQDRGLMPAPVGNGYAGGGGMPNMQPPNSGRFAPRPGGANGMRPAPNSGGMGSYGYQPGAAPGENPFAGGEDWRLPPLPQMPQWGDNSGRIGGPSQTSRGGWDRDGRSYGGQDASYDGEGWPRLRGE